jgi:hypothetical protein
VPKNIPSILLFFIYKKWVNYLSLETYLINFATYCILKKMDTEIKKVDRIIRQIPSVKILHQFE